MSQRRESRLPGGVTTRLPYGDRFAATLDRVSPVRVAALAGAVGLLLSSLFVLETVLTTVNTTLFGIPTTRLLSAIVVTAFVAATVLARYVTPRVALGLGGAMLAGGLTWHTLSLDSVPSLAPMVASNVELLTGRGVTEIIQADIWALGIAPAPVFLTWYLALRREYVGATLAGGATLSYFVLTGDATGLVTLLGVASGAALLGFGDLDTTDWAGGAPDYVAIVVALMVVTPLVVTIVPGGAASPVTFLGEDGQTMEESLVSTDSDLDIVGSVSQSADVRFTVRSDEANYWRTGSFDRYTGDGWVRSGAESEYESDAVSEPPGEVEFLVQEVDIETEFEALPAAWKPVEVSTSIADRTKVTREGGFRVEGGLEAGRTYQVLSATTDPTTQELVEAGTDYPDEVEKRYTQLPADTPDRVGEQTAELLESAETPYEAARVTEQWLKQNREYSLDVEKPDGNIADAFLFEMEAGYCTYYATTMVTMLRTQGIPARFAVGYNPGQPVEDDEYVVRGLNSHAWVEVYFPEVGWVPFDPTPADPREEVEQAAIESARASGSDSVDTAETVPNETESDSEPGSQEILQTDRLTNRSSQGGSQGSSSIDPAITRVPGQEQGDVASADPLNVSFDGLGVNTADSNESAIDGSGGGGGDPILPPREQLALGAIALIGAVAGLRQSRVGRRLTRTARIRYQRRSDPATDLERAHERLLLILERDHRPKRPGETTRQYLDAVGADRRAERVAELRERARYADEVSSAAADEAVSLVDSIRADR